MSANERTAVCAHARSHLEPLQIDRDLERSSVLDELVDVEQSASHVRQFLPWSVDGYLRWRTPQEAGSVASAGRLLSSSLFPALWKSYVPLWL